MAKPAATKSVRLNASLRALGILDIQIERLAGEMDLEVSRVKARYAGRITTHQANREKLAHEIELFCVDNRVDLLPPKAKSLRLLFGRISWRFSPPSVSLACGVDGERAAMLLREHGHGDLVRERLEPNKPVILAALATEKISAVKLKGAGLRVNPGHEEFHAEPDRAEIEKAQGD